MERRAALATASADHSGAGSSPNYLTSADRARVSMAAILRAWTDRAWTPQMLHARCGDQISSLRLGLLEHGKELPTPREVDLLTKALQMDRDEFDLHVRTELMYMLDRRSGGRGVPFPHIQINIDLLLAADDEVLKPVKRLLVAHLGGNDRTSNGMLVAPDLVRSLAQMCGLEPLDCWQRLGRYIDRNEFTNP